MSSSHIPATVPAQQDAVIIATIFPIVFVVVVLVSNVAIIALMLLIFMCWTKKKNKMRSLSSPPNRLSVRSVDIQDNACYAIVVSTEKYVNIIVFY